MHPSLVVIPSSCCCIQNTRPSISAETCSRRFIRLPSSKVHHHSLLSLRDGRRVLHDVGMPQSLVLGLGLLHWYWRLRRQSDLRRQRYATAVFGAVAGRRHFGRERNL